MYGAREYLNLICSWNEWFAKKKLLLRFHHQHQTATNVSRYANLFLNLNISLKWNEHLFTIPINQTPQKRLCCVHHPDHTTAQQKRQRHRILPPSRVYYTLFRVNTQVKELLRHASLSITKSRHHNAREPPISWNQPCERYTGTGEFRLTISIYFKSAVAWIKSFSIYV